MSSRNWLLLTVSLACALVVAILALPPWSPLSITSTERLETPTEAAGQRVSEAAAQSLEQRLFDSNAAGEAYGDAAVAAPTPPHQSVEDLIKATEDPEWKARWDAVNALGMLQDPRGIPALVKRALTDDNPHPRWRSLWALKAVDPDGSRAVPPLTTGLEDPDPVVVRNAALALAFFGRPESRQELLMGLQDIDAWRRWEVVFSLRNVGDPLVTQALIPLLNEDLEPVTRVRQETALTLGRIGGEDTIVPLLYALRHDHSPQVRWRAAIALSQVGDASLVDQLEDALFVEQDIEVQGFLEQAIARLRQR